MNFNELSVLGSILDDTYTDATEGRESNGSFKIIARLDGDSGMKITCMIVVNLLNRSEMRSEAAKAEDQLAQACNAKLKQVKKEFKDQCGRALKTKQGGMDHSVELMNMSAYSPKGTALVRNVYSFEIS
tara:strand:- start:935 stop:1321 length:387 start_codon:yes stop_codon:yes gene_type:complete